MTQTTRGVTVTAKDGVVALKGTATETGWAMLDIDSFVLDGTCILSSNVATNTRVSVANKSYKLVLEQNKSNTLENAEVSKVCFNITEGKTYDISNILIQIEKGSVATSYEPYTGGIPSPNPDYPQEIKSVVKPTVKVVGANIMQLNDIGETTVSGITVSCEDGVIKAKGTTLKDSTIPLSGSGGFIVMKSMTLQNSKTYIFNPNPIKQTESSECYLDFTNEKNLGFSLSNNNINKPIKPTDSRTQYPFNLNIAVKQGTVVDMEWKPQLLLNESLLPYEPYKEQSIQLPITLNAIPVSSGGNVTINGQQYIADYVDVERGKIVKCIEKYRISSDLNWIYEPSENDRFGVYGLNININPNFVINTLFTHYKNKPNGDGGFIAPGNIRLHNFQGFTDVTNFKEWLDKNESYAYFAKNTLEEIDLTIEEIQIFKALATYYPTTNISVNSEQLDGYTVFNYPISMANGWNYVKQQLNDNRNYIYDMDLQSAEAYVNSEYAVALTELEV